ncbi:DUF302 domain-containing protein [Cyanobium sp. ATX-6F1]|uniref:DUF302 domain-containing protein n=1 Tax=Cyanobium sp. ATX-6F1 TaxID=3137388 RepID=UPI0039BEC92C
MISPHESLFPERHRQILRGGLRGPGGGHPRPRLRAARGARPGETLRSKGLDFPEQCRVFEVCNPQQAAKVLRADINLATALPCRISVSRQDGRTRIAMVRPAVMLSALSSDPELAEVARQVEATTIAIIEAAA